MKTTIDRAGRVVIPKSVRDEAGIEGVVELEVGFRDGRIEMEPATVPMRVARRGDRAIVEADESAMPVLKTSDVRDVLDRSRR